MQPYTFPYVGYYQLANAVDMFVFLDDVNYINRGWINRNTIVVNNKPQYFTIPLKGASQNRLIKDISVDKEKIKDVLLTIKQQYVGAPEFLRIFPIVERVLSHNTINAMAQSSIVEVMKYLNCEFASQSSSLRHPKGELRGQERILSICGDYGATKYINPCGGVNLYDGSQFKAKGITLKFLKARIRPNLGLSMLDVLMRLPPEEIKQYLTEYDEIEGACEN